MVNKILCDYNYLEQKKKKKKTINNDENIGESRWGNTITHEYRD